MTTVAVKWARQPLTRTLSADFTLPGKTRYQIVAYTDSTACHYGVRNPDFGDQWTHGVFRYAESWREKHGWPSQWTVDLFQLMVSDFLTMEEES